MIDILILAVLFLAGLFALELLYFRIARHYGIMDHPSLRGSSDQVTIRGGGIVFYLSALVCFLTTQFSFPWFMLGLTIVSVLSFWDDISSLSPRTRLPLQFLGMLLMLWQLISTTGLTMRLSPWLIGLIALVGLIVSTGAMNIYNFMDGINGITGGYSLVVLAAIAFVLKKDAGVEYYISDVQCLILCGITFLAALVFCFFNFRHKARCFAGDVGSVSMSFIVLFLLGYLIITRQSLCWLGFLVVYGVDGCLTICHRLLLHENITKPHRKHMFQLMANELHIPHTTVSLIYMAAQALCCVALIVWPGYLTLALEIVILSLIYVLFMKKFYHLHAESGNV